VRVGLVVGCAIVGLAVGTLAVCPVYRLSVPAGRVRGGCARCGERLPAGWRGWLRVPARCPACRRPLQPRSWTYLAAGLVLFAALGARLPLADAADPILAGAWLTLATAGLVLAGVDIQVQRLPRPIIVITAAVITAQITAAALVRHHPRLLINAAVAALVFALAYLVLAVLGPGLVGAGDIYLAGLLGLLLGTGPLRQILVGAVLPYLLGAAVIAARLAAGQLSRRDKVALGPYLLAGAILAKIVFP
jgi:leader peptidase (prepilin peptidase) / N-methyltransferase